MKRINTFLLVALCFAVILAGSVVSVPSVSAEETTEVTVTHTFPSSLKIGEHIDDYAICYAHLDPSRKDIACPSFWDGQLIFTPLPDGRNEYPLGISGVSYYPLGGIDAASINEDGTASWAPLWNAACFYLPGTLTIYPGYAYLDDNWEYAESDWVAVGDPIVVTIEEPVIQTNLPAQVRVGERFALTTELTNTALKNSNISYYEDLDPWVDDPENGQFMPGFRPFVEIIEGADLVAQSEQDYTNTLKSSETLTFTGSGTVTLRVTYSLFESMTEWDESNNSWIAPKYSVEKIVTIQVTDGEAVIPSLGDLGGDGEINAEDYMLLKRYCLGTFLLTDAQKAVADVNKDGEINAEDYMLLKRAVLGSYVIA